jgi:DNA-binding XRE family transcriptional regulator
MTVRKDKRRRLEAKGWKVSNTREFLKLTAEELAYIDLKLRLGSNLRERRERRSLTQAGLAKLISSSQSRVAKMEAGDPSVSLDLVLRSLLILGASSLELSRIIHPGRRSFPLGTPGGSRHRNAGASNSSTVPRVLSVTANTS